MTVAIWVRIAALVAMISFGIWWSLTDQSFRITTPFSELLMMGLWYGGVRYGRWKEHKGRNSRWDGLSDDLETILLDFKNGTDNYRSRHDDA